MTRCTLFVWDTGRRYEILQLLPTEMHKVDPTVKANPGKRDDETSIVEARKLIINYMYILSRGVLKSSGISHWKIAITLPMPGEILNGRIMSEWKKKQFDAKFWEEVEDEETEKEKNSGIRHKELNQSWQAKRTCEKLKKKKK